MEDQQLVYLEVEVVPLDLVISVDSVLLLLVLVEEEQVEVVLLVLLLVEKE